MANIDFLTGWQDEVAKYVKGIDNTKYQTLLEDEIRDTLRDFCKRTALWWYDVWFDVVADINYYPLDGLFPADPDPNAADIVIIESVKFKSDGEDPDTYRDLPPLRAWVENVPDKNAGGWQYYTGNEPTNFYFDELDNILFLHPTPELDSAPDGIEARLILMPAHTATELPDFFWRQYKRAIGTGIAGSLMQLTNKPWSDEELGKIKEAEYDSWVTEAKSKKQSGYTRRTTQVQFPHYGGSRGSSWVF